MNAAGSRRSARRLGWAATLLCLASACGPTVPAREPEPAPAPEASAEPANAEPAHEAAPADPSAAASSAAAAEAPVDRAGDDELDADMDALSKATKSPESNAAEGKAAEGKAAEGKAAEGKAAEGLVGREVVYRVTPQGLLIELGGIHVRPVAKAFRDAKGNYGVDLQLTAESFDDRQYWLSKPAEGPLSIAGRIEAPSGKRQRFGDERHGNDEEVVRAGEPRQFKQRWPGKGQPRLRAGETLTLEVGLWGVHADSERERPVRRLFEVKLVGAQPPQAVVSPPTLDWGS